jgi:serine/threonine protein kinase
MDFGIAKSMEDFGKTASGVMLGTPTYMSPEQASGDDMIDHRSDIYSLGVLGYHMLTGRPPFVGNSPHAVIAGHVADKPEPIRRRNPSIPKSLADAIEKCLAKDPEHRFQTAMQLSEELQQVTFGIEPAPVEHNRGNYAMPFFAGMALVFEALATFGTRSVAELTTRELWYFTGGFALLALLTSPVVRAATIPLSEELREKVAAIRGRLSLP